VETGAHRELLEETGLTAELTLVGVVQRAGRDGETVRFHVFTGTTDASQEDVVCGEGEAMVFLPRDELNTRPASRAARQILALALGQ
jgi:8-oxo-dGTP pyrophosphatase MutT (NUDIX family)